MVSENFGSPGPACPGAGGGGQDSGRPDGGGGAVCDGTGAGNGAGGEPAGAPYPPNEAGRDCMVIAGDGAAGAPGDAASCCPQPPQNCVPGSTEYPQDGHHPSISAMLSLSG
ncbi:MAG TPA: hypothetical protein VGD91_02570, partial [Trebonia sp.]